MNDRFIRVYQKIDFVAIKERLLIYGALSGSCAHCKAIDIKLERLRCPSCGVEFAYIAFQNIRDHLPKMARLAVERPNMVFIDFEDFKRIEGMIKAENFLK